MGKTVVITSGKGGVGKTTVTANVGTALSMIGKRVLLIDTDTGLRNLDMIMGIEDKALYNVIDVTEKTCNLDGAAVQSARFPNLYILPASQTRDKEELHEEKFKELCDEAKKRFDYVLIEYGFRCALYPADEAVIVTVPDKAAMRDADRVAGIIETQFKNVKEIRLCINRLIPELSDSGLTAGSAEALFTVAVKLIGIVPEDPNILIDAYNSELSVNNRRSLAGRAFKNIACRLDGIDIKLLKLNKRRLFKKRYR